ncbi:hypothetical protein SAICODRAFT_79778 [Saitoella complicata NRRL Y-17804]|uniref:uncharacterized protein n=1 Tax=Saitoella complicata (strain BCRC 22490 / CBS 7301 / JCM 7358 / NBRC 10748 / NRRL Y-17804) TaxID=698492 RepID=UPI0008672955|nr:uncharacterized protein SAICODRAFT_79778 [Saitoella complicata NRRL Y-17804]ODQ53487.1 hypothetical protein SAICODRAFT_79778 [Saitoella complicata NRRL Y-17804]
MFAVPATFRSSLGKRKRSTILSDDLTGAAHISDNAVEHEKDVHNERSALAEQPESELADLPDEVIDPTDEVELKEDESDLRQHLLPPDLIQLPTMSTTRSLQKRHLTALTALMHVSLLRRDWERAYKAFSVLIRMKDVNFKKIWGIGLEVLKHARPDKAPLYLKRMCIRYPVLSNANKDALDARTFFRALILLRIERAQHNPKEYSIAQEEMEEKLSDPSYTDDPMLHTYTGMVCLARSGHETDIRIREMLREIARKCFEATAIKGGVTGISHQILRELQALKKDESKDDSED